MTGTKDKLRSLFLTALMVLSVFAGTVAFAGTAAAANEDITFTDQTIQGTLTSPGQFTVQSVDPGDTDTVDKVAFWTLTQSNDLSQVIQVNDSMSFSGAAQSVTVTANSSLRSAAYQESRIAVTWHNASSSVNASSVRAEDTAVLTIPDAQLTGSPGNVQSVWQGQNLWLDPTTMTGHSAADPAELYKNTSSGPQLVTEMRPDDPTTPAEKIGTDDKTGTFFVSDDGPTLDSTEFKFQVVPQTMETSFARNEVSVVGDQTEVQLNIDSNRGGYIAYASAPGLDSDEMLRVLNADKWNNSNNLGTMVPVDTIGFEGVQMTGVAKDTNHLTNWSGQDAGTYDFSFTVFDTTASDTASIEAAEIEGDLNLDKGTYQVTRGDFAEFTVEMEETSEGYLWIGGTEVNFLRLVQIQDTDQDGDVTLRMNTLWADRTENQAPVPVYTSETDDVSDVTDRVPASDFDKLGINRSLNNVIEPATYEVQAALDDSYNIQAGELSVSSVDVSAMVVTAPGIPQATPFIAPKLRANGYDGPGELKQAITQSSDVAIGDQMIVRYNVSGVFGGIQDAQDLASHPNVSLSFVQTNPSVNRDPLAIEYGQSPQGAEAYVDSENGTIWAVVDSSRAEATNYGGQNIPTLEAGQNYVATLDISLRSFNGSTTGLTNSSIMQLQERSATIQIPGNLDHLEFTSDANRTVNATTNVAPGSEVTVRARGFGDSAFLEPSDAVVMPYDGDANGWISANTLDLSDVAEGTSFEVSVRQGGSQIGGPVPAMIVAAQQGQLQFDDQIAREGGTLVTVQSVTMNKDGFIAIHDDTGAIVGVSRYLENGTYNNVDVRLNETSAVPAGDSMTLTAMLHEDTNDDRVFNFIANPELDGPFMVNGSAVTDSASVEHTTPTPTPTTTTPTPTTTTPTPTTTTPTPTTTTPTPTTTEPPTTTTTESGGPGFGVIVALVALVAAALLAVRRER